MKKKYLIIGILLLTSFIPLGFNSVKADTSKETLINNICDGGLDENFRNAAPGSVYKSVATVISECTTLLNSSSCGVDANCLRDTVCNNDSLDSFYGFCSVTMTDTKRDKSIISFCNNFALNIDKSIAIDKPKATVIKECQAALKRSVYNTDSEFEAFLCESNLKSYLKCGTNNGSLHSDIIYEVCSNFEHEVEERKSQNKSFNLGTLETNRCFDTLMLNKECDGKVCYSNALCDLIPEESKDLFSACNPAAWVTPGDEYGEYDAGNCYGFGEVVYYITMVIKIFQIAAPILLIIWASVDLVKSITSSDEKRIIEKRKPIIQRFVAAGLIFLIPLIVELIVDGFSINGDEGSWLECWKNNNFKYTSARKVTDDELQALYKSFDKKCNCECETFAKNDNNCIKSCKASFHDSECDKESNIDIQDCIQNKFYEWYKDYFKKDLE